jgi:hypothetical protein
LPLELALELEFVLELDVSVLDRRKDVRWALSKDARVPLTVDVLTAEVDIIRFLLEIAHLQRVGVRGETLSEKRGMQITNRDGAGKVPGES